MTKKSYWENFLVKIHAPAWLVLVLATIFVLRIPSFFEPFSYGDEMIYLTLGEGIRRGLILFKDIHDNKPPLLYFVAAIAGNVFWFRVILAFWMMITTIIFWRLTEVLFAKKLKLQQIAVWSFAILTTIPLLEGQIANAEIFMIGPSILAFLILFTRKLTPINLLSAGILFGISALFKIPAAFDAPVIVFLWLLTTKITTQNFFKLGRKKAILILGFALPLIFSFAWYQSRGALSDYLVAAFGQNVGYLSAFRPEDVAKPFLVKNGPLIIRAAIVGIGLLILALYRKKLSQTFIFATIWLLFSLFAITLSERPYPHYLIQAVPAVSILIALLVAAKNKEQVLVIIPLTLALVVPVYFKFWYYPTFPYYSRFLELAIGKITKEEYFDRFDGNVSRNYRLAEYINQISSPQDSLFVWGDSPPIYALTRRLPPLKYVALYHLNDFSSPEEIITRLKSTLPKIIVILPNAPEFPALEPFLDEAYLTTLFFDEAQVWRLKTDEKN